MYAPRSATSTSNGCVRASTAVFCRVSESSVGPSWRVSAEAQAAAVSTPSAGRHTCRFGIARSAASCSTGWCVGPSSPRKIESWVKTNVARSLESAASRIGGRM